MSMTLEIRPAVATDAATLAAVAALTFPLACPPSTDPASIADFIATHLSARSFDAYLADATRAILLAFVDGTVAGYTMIIFGEPTDPDVVASISIHPTAELSKVYVDGDHHGAGVAQALVQESIAVGIAHGAAGMWLGVNSENARANRFYEKCGFATVGTKTFKLGDRLEDDFVRERPLGPQAPIPFR
jgi:diamine N-acetyltransferase